MLKITRDDHHDTVYTSYTTNEISNRNASFAYYILLTVKYPILRLLINPATFHDIKLKLVNVNFWEIALYVYLPRVTKMCQEGIHKISCG